MYKPYLSPLELGPALRDRIEPPIFEALFKHIVQHPPAKHVRGAPSLTVSQAKEILGIALPHSASGSRDRFSHSLRET